MPAEKSTQSPSTLALKTQLEEDFVSPLTAIRGALEILRDFPELGLPQRQRFVETALLECARLEKGVEHLATTVYAAGQREPDADATPAPAGGREDPSRRIHFLDEGDTVEVDLSDLEFDSSQTVNAFYDVLDRLIEASGRSWYFLVNYRGCSIWPEAWVAFAHRGKKVNVSYSLGTVRYAEDADAHEGPAGTAAGDPHHFDSRAEALAHIETLRRQSGARRGTR